MQPFGRNIIILEDYWKTVILYKVDFALLMEQKGMTFDHDFYVVVGKQCRTENAYAGHQHNIFI